MSRLSQVKSALHERRARLREIALRKLVHARWAARAFQRPRPHGLNRELIVSLTSYPARYPTLDLTLKCLLTQSIRADRVVLWLAEEDEPRLPPAVKELERCGLTIRLCEDHRSYKKILPALKHYPEAYVITADDDVFYETGWAEELVRNLDPSKHEVVCHRAHRILLNENRLPRPYLRWDWRSSMSGPSRLLFPTGVGGVLYKPGIFLPEVTRVDRSMELCPTADDVWLYFMAALNGATFKNLGKGGQDPCEWRGSQESALGATNVIGDGNDRQIARMIDVYGFPGN